MAPGLREHLANKGSPNEAEQMVRENNPGTPWEQQERGDIPGVASFPELGFARGCLRELLQHPE